MEEEFRSLPFECRGCWHVWEADYLVRHGEDRHGNEHETWMLAGSPVAPPPSGTDCPRCGCQQAIVFPAGYLSRHPELRTQAGPVAPDATPLLSPVPKRFFGL
ncbi:hypothetical protein [Nonomuraea rhizosphaerae]|uniref:hypothetical protein n=1 Tax=Nonomuraea rhizosphaerae TaxID=2665663 RepID=UPI001C5E642F|nr:hypothetical protein [Nonomuraea rhizosphaerae]